MAPLANIGTKARTERGLRERLRAALGGDEAVYTDPTGQRVAVDQSIVDHIIGPPRREGDREQFFPFIRELIERPQEIWVGFATENATGRVDARRRYVRLLKLGGAEAIVLVADIDGGHWAGLTFFSGSAEQRRARSGLRVFRDNG